MIQVLVSGVLHLYNQSIDISLMHLYLMSQAINAWTRVIFIAFGNGYSCVPSHSYMCIKLRYMHNLLELHACYTGVTLYSHGHGCNIGADSST